MEAIVDLVYTKRVVARAELEAQISVRGWRDYRPVQPVQLSGALRRLLLEDPPRIIEDTTSHATPINTLRIPETTGTKRELERLRGQVRKQHLRYVHWSQNEQLCGRHAERVVRDSLLVAAPAAGLWMPPGVVPGEVHTVDGVDLPGALTLDLWGWMLAVDDGRPIAEVPFVIEVKNVRRWLYAQAPELWELLVKAAHIALVRPVLPILNCCWSGPTAWWMAYDVGFFTVQMREQVFAPTIDAASFDALVEESGLVMTRHEGAHPAVVDWLSRDLRKDPPSLPPEPGLPWYRRQVERFSQMAPAILDFAALAGTLTDKDRKNVFGAFKARVKDTAVWPLRGGW